MAATAVLAHGPLRGAMRQPMTWLQDGFSNVSNEPPGDLEKEYMPEDEEVLDLRGNPWVFHPCEGTAKAPTAAARQGGAPVQEPDLPVPYTFTYLQSEPAQNVVRILLAAPMRGTGADTVAKRLSTALKEFVKASYQVLVKIASNGQSFLPESDRQTIVHEAQAVMKALVCSGRVNVETDFIFCLEAFGATKGKSHQERDWQTQCLFRCLDAAFSVPEFADRTQKQKEALRARIRDDAMHFYSDVDVLSWPHILSLLQCTGEVLDRRELSTQVKFQLCSARQKAALEQGMKQAAHLLQNLKAVDCFEAYEINEIFNDKEHFQLWKRQEMLATILKEAPRALVQDVLYIIDEGADPDGRDDEELTLVRELIVSLGEDVRQYKHMFFKMRCDWIADRGNWSPWGRGRRSANARCGVVLDQELTPDQVCDHIEDEPNHPEYLKHAVSAYIKADRKTEAAKMLARPKSRVTSCFDSNRNDKELIYRISLEQEISPPADVFAPIEEDTLVLPYSGESVFYVGCSADIAQLEQETLSHGRPMVLGISWFWRCFDTRLDLWSRASLVALAYENRLVLVDLMKFESSVGDIQERAKDLLRRIMEAGHLVKVVHGLDKMELQALQRTTLPHHVLQEEKHPAMPRLSPLLDLSFVAAYVQSGQSGAVWKLPGLVFMFLRFDLCFGEALSNFERRPLRETQKHYALTMAWAPLMILKALCSHGIVSPSEVAMMLGQPSFPTDPAQRRRSWDELWKYFSDLAPPTDGATSVQVEGEYATNYWESQEWVQNLPQPARSKVSLSDVLRPMVGEQLISEEAKQVAMPSLNSLFDRDAARRELSATYQAFTAHQQEVEGQWQEADS